MIVHNDKKLLENIEVKTRGQHSAPFLPLRASTEEKDTIVKHEKYWLSKDSDGLYAQV